MSEVAKKDEQLPAESNVFDFGADAGAGMEGTDRDSFAIPFLRIIQKSSPIVDETSGEYNPDAKAGMLHNTVTGELYDGKEGVTILFCAYQRRFLHWGPRGTSEAGYKGEMMPEEVAQLEQSQSVIRNEGKMYFPLEDGTVSDKKCDQLVDTRSHFGLLIDPETHVATRCLLALSSTGVKKSKALMSLLDGVRVQGPSGMVRPPSWAIKIRLTTYGESNEKGSWHLPKFASEGVLNPATDRELLDLGKDFHAALIAGDVGANYAAEQDQVAPSEQF